VAAVRVPRRILTGLGITAVLGVLAVLTATPSVGDAPARAAALATAHRSGPLLTALPDRITAAVLAVEDHRFYLHDGLDPLAMPRVARAAFTGTERGGATIEAQLAKWLYTDGRRTPGAQAEQVVLAYKLDAVYSKSEILLMYLDTVYFGHGYYGVAAACRGYFGVAPDRVDWSQAALLAGLLQAPDAYEPHDHPAAAANRRHEALLRLVSVGAISPAQAADADRSALL
jgi:membrane peptidoglycan carboxypeptidase